MPLALPFTQANAALRIVVTLLIVLEFIVLPCYLLVALIPRAGAAKERADDRAGSLPNRVPGPVSPRVSAIFWVCFLVMVGSFCYIGSAPKPGGPVTHAPATPWLIWGVGTAAVLTGLFVHYLFIKRFDPLISSSLKQARLGNLRVASDQLRAGILVKPTVQGLFNLSNLVIATSDYVEARKLLLQAQEQGLAPEFSNQHGDCSYGMGRTYEAMTFLETHGAQSSASLPEICTYCNLLIIEKRLEDAKNQISSCEELFRSLNSPISGLSRQYRGLIDNCRLRLRQAMAGKPVARDNER